MLALYPDEEVERASRCHGHQQKVIAIRHEFDTCPVTSTDSHQSLQLQRYAPPLGTRWVQQNGPGHWKVLLPVAGACLLVTQMSDVISLGGSGMNGGVAPFRERQEQILDDVLELMAPAERGSVASPRLVEVECCRLQVLLEAIDLDDQPLEFRFHRVERQCELRETGVFVPDAALRPPADEVAADDPHQSDQRLADDVIELDPRHRRSPDCASRSRPRCWRESCRQAS